jgi:hypothetical protein
MTLCFSVTFFADHTAREKREEAFTPQALADLIRSTSAPEKARLPWLKLARFGNAPTGKGSLRHDRNVIACSGIEADYDGEQIGFAEAVDMLEKAGVHAIVYTSPSHTDATPRWRVVCPFSCELSPDRRQHMLGRLNGLFRGIFASESWTLSQAFYYGSVGNNPHHRVEVIDGEFIDQLDELDLIAVGKPASKAGNRHPSAPGPIDEKALIEQICAGESYHPAAMRLIGSWALHGVPVLAARGRLVRAFEGVTPADRDDRWRARFASIPAMLEWVYGKEAEKREGADQDVYAKLPADLRRLIDVGVDGEQRKREIARLAGLLVPLIGSYDALDLVLCWNAARCRPPLPTAEIYGVVDWIAGRELRRPRRHQNGK